MLLDNYLPSITIQRRRHIYYSKPKRNSSFNNPNDNYTPMYTPHIIHRDNNRSHTTPTQLSLPQKITSNNKPHINPNLSFSVSHANRNITKPQQPSNFILVLLISHTILPLKQFQTHNQPFPQPATTLITPTIQSKITNTKFKKCDIDNNNSNNFNTNRSENINKNKNKNTKNSNNKDNK